MGDIMLSTATKAGMPANREIKLITEFKVTSEVIKTKLILRTLKRKTVGLLRFSLKLNKLEIMQEIPKYNISPKIKPTTEKPDAFIGKKKHKVNTI